MNLPYSSKLKLILITQMLKKVSRCKIKERAHAHTQTKIKIKKWNEIKNLEPHFYKLTLNIENSYNKQIASFLQPELNFPH